MVKEEREEKDSNISIIELIRDKLVYKDEEERNKYILIDKNKNIPNEENKENENNKDEQKINENEVKDEQNLENNSQNNKKEDKNGFLT